MGIIEATLCWSRKQTSGEGHMEREAKEKQDKARIRLEKTW